MASDQDIVVRLERVSKTFRQRQPGSKWWDVGRNLLHPNIKLVHALSEIDLTIHRGEIVAYAGPNGAGKSTTVKMLSGLLAPDSGTVHSLGFDPVRQRKEYVGKIGVVYGQRTELWWDMPVSATFEWKKAVWDIPDSTYSRMLGFVREALRLDEFFNTLARELSLGQRMRADLALSVIHEPEILFLDEPTIGVDVLAKKHLLQVIKQLNDKRNMTVMVTSHDMADLEQLAGRIVMIDRGKIAFDGDFSTLRRDFADRRNLIIVTAESCALQLTGAEPIQSDGFRHEFTFNAARNGIAGLLDEAATQARIVDVETHSAPIDDVIADIYERWQKEHAGVAARS